ncbi:unnamed protein product [Cylicocyclus nassatus]|uniref:Uncharacterized protein n=1 Tax=Cylicocyclus nassatus TaxID=53992 RepID=A0AA36GTB2_CYLNA|nr:unnamed protein product [Cylicocyclus nassatus]
MYVFRHGSVSLLLSLQALLASAVTQKLIDYPQKDSEESSPPVEEYRDTEIVEVANSSTVEIEASEDTIVVSENCNFTLSYYDSNNTSVYAVIVLMGCRTSAMDVWSRMIRILIRI